MSLVTKIIHNMYYDESYGNWLPAETENAFECDYCHTENDTAYAIPWKKDFHVCEDCIDDFLDDTANDCLNLETFKYTCPVCDEIFDTKDEFIFHVINNHLDMEDSN